MGVGTAYPITDLVDLPPAIVSHDSPRPLADGEYQGPQFRGPKFIEFGLEIEGTSEADLVLKVETLKTAWQPLSVNVGLEINTPYLGARLWTGRPFDLVGITYSQAATAGWLMQGIRCRFKAGNPVSTAA